MTEEKKPPINPIEEYLKGNDEKPEFNNLFEASKSDIDLKTDLSHPEIMLINTLIYTNKFFKARGLETLYSYYTAKYVRLKVSKDRLSRAEFVDINKKERFENNLNKFNAFQNLADVKK